MAIRRKRCETCAHLHEFELSRDLYTCPVVNIRLHAETIVTFGCSFWESKAKAAFAKRAADRLRREGVDAK